MWAAQADDGERKSALLPSRKLADLKERQLA